MINSVIFSPILSLVVLLALGCVVIIGVAIVLMRGLRGWALRGCAGLVVLLALSGHSLQQEDRDNTELRRITVGDGEGDARTQLK